MKAFKAIVLSLVAIILGLLIWGFFWLAGLERSFLNPSFYQNLITETGIVRQLHQTLGDELPDLLKEEIDDEEELEKVEKLIETLLVVYDEVWFEEKLLDNIEKLDYLLNGEPEKFSLEIDLTEKRDEFRSELILVIEEMMQEEEPDKTIDRAEVTEMVDEIMAEMEFLNEPIVLDFADADSEEFVQTVEQINDIKRIVWLVFIGIVIFLIGLVFLILKLFSGLTYLGILTMIMSATFITKIFVFRLITVPLLLNQIEYDIPEDTIRNIITFVTNQLLLYPIVFFALGLVLLLVGKLGPRFMKKEKDDVSKKVITEEDFLDEKIE